MRKQYVTILSVIKIIITILYVAYVATILSQIKMQNLTDLIDFNIADLITQFMWVFALFMWVYLAALYILRRIYSIKIMKILVDECDPEKFLTEYDRFYKTNAGSLRTQSINYINKYYAYICLGAFDIARQIILSSPSPEIVGSKTYTALYFTNAAHQHTIDGDYEKARLKLDYVRNLKMMKNIKTNCAIAIDGNESTILRKQGHLPESRKLLNDLLQRVTHKSHILECTFALALIDDEEQKYDAARIAFTKVAEEGNKLYIASQAKQMLS